MVRVREGDRRAFRTLVERYWARLAAYAEGIVESPDAAEDVVQRTFIRLWGRRSEWTPRGSTSAYLYLITRNLALNSQRDRDAESVRRARAVDGGYSLGNGAGPDHDLAAESLRGEVEKALRSLPARRREVFVLSRYHGLSHREISETMGIAPQTVANQMRAALTELRRLLRHHLED